MCQGIVTLQYESAAGIILVGSIDQREMQFIVDALNEKEQRDAEIAAGAPESGPGEHDLQPYSVALTEADIRQARQILDAEPVPFRYPEM